MWPQQRVDNDARGGTKKQTRRLETENRSPPREGKGGEGDEEMNAMADEG